MILATRKADGDKNSQIPNIQAILQAYRSKSLTWTDGLVTYWAKGKKLCEPRPFDWDEFEAINSANGGHKSFWVEGVSLKLLSTHMSLETLIVFYLGAGPRSSCTAADNTHT